MWSVYVSEQVGLHLPLTAVVMRTVATPNKRVMMRAHAFSGVTHTSRTEQIRFVVDQAPGSSISQQGRIHAEVNYSDLVQEGKVILRIQLFRAPVGPEVLSTGLEPASTRCW